MSSRYHPPLVPPDDDVRSRDAVVVEHDIAVSTATERHRAPADQLERQADA